MSSPAVIFDLDGTLLDTLDDLTQSMNHALSCQGFPTHSAQTYRQLIGGGINHLALVSLPPEQNTPKKIEKTVKLMKEHYQLHWKDVSKPYSGIPELLEALQTQSIPLAVLSNKLHAFTLEMTQYFFPHISFRAIFGQIPEFPPKPHPGLALHIAQEHLQTKPADIFYLGDTPTDMQTAKQAGFRRIGVSWGFRCAEELSQHGAQIVIKSPLELLSLLNERLEAPN